MKWLFASLAVFFMVAPTLAGEPYIGIVGNDINADTFYLSPKYTQFLYNQRNLPNVPVCFRIPGVPVSCEVFNAETPKDQPEVCDTQGKGKAPHFRHRGLPNALTPAGNSGWYEWWIRLPRKPSGQVSVVIQCGVLSPGAFASYGFKAIKHCAAETGERPDTTSCVPLEVGAGKNPLEWSVLPRITAVAYPGPSNNFKAFNLTAFKNPSSYLLEFAYGDGFPISDNGNPQVLDGSPNARILLKACQDSTVVAKLPVAGQINLLNQMETALEAGDMIKVRMTVPLQNTVDIYCHAQSAKLTGEGESPF